MSLARLWPCFVAVIFLFLGLAVMSVLARMMVPIVAIVAGNGDSSVADRCTANTGGSCLMFDCFGWRGNASCIDFQCRCSNGFCTNSRGICIPFKEWERGLTQQSFSLSTSVDLGTGPVKMYLQPNSLNTSWLLAPDGNGALLQMYQLDGGNDIKLLWKSDGFVEGVLGGPFGQTPLLPFSEHMPFWQQFPMPAAPILPLDEVSPDDRNAIQFEEHEDGTVSIASIVSPKFQLCTGQLADKDGASAVWLPSYTVMDYIAGMPTRFSHWQTYQDTNYTDWGNVKPSQAFLDNCDGSMLGDRNCISVAPMTEAPRSAACHWSMEPGLKVSLGKWQALEQVLPNRTCLEKQRLGPNQLLSYWPLGGVMVVLFGLTIKCLVGAMYTTSWLPSVFYNACCDTYHSCESKNQDADDQCCEACCLPCIGFIPTLPQTLPACCMCTCAFFNAVWMVAIALAITIFQLAAMPFLEKYHIDNMDRSILYCYGEIGFTVYALPLWGGLAASKAWSIVTNQNTSGQDDQIKLPRLGELPIKNKMQNMGMQCIDFLGDVGTLLAKHDVFPSWWSSVWAFTVMLSFAQIILWILGGALTETQFNGTMLQKLQCVGVLEHSLQLLLSMYGFNFMPPDNEYQLYSALAASLSLVRLAQTAACPREEAGKADVQKRVITEHPLLAAPKAESMKAHPLLDKSKIPTPQPMNN